MGIQEINDQDSIFEGRRAAGSGQRAARQGRPERLKSRTSSPSLSRCNTESRKNEKNKNPLGQYSKVTVEKKQCVLQ